MRVRGIASRMLEEGEVHDGIHTLAVESLGDARRSDRLGQVDPVVARLAKGEGRRREVEQHDATAPLVGVEVPRETTTENAERAGERDPEPAHRLRTTLHRRV